MYKGAAFVGETIESVLAQSYQNWEMIIVDDCSPDDGTGIAEVNKYTSDPRIKLIASKENRGSSGARNIALKEAKGRYIAFLDSDDIWHHDFLEKQLNYMRIPAPRHTIRPQHSSVLRADEYTPHTCLRIPKAK